MSRRRQQNWGGGEGRRYEPSRLDRILCWLGLHDWRNMDGFCRCCGKRDGIWFGP